jgi:hypothetical protein
VLPQRQLALPESVNGLSTLSQAEACALARALVSAKNFDLEPSLTVGLGQNRPNHFSGKVAPTQKKTAYSSRTIAN